MADSKPSTENFENAIRELEDILARYKSDTSDRHIRAGLVKNFEFTYESACKILPRYLEYASASADQSVKMSFPEMIRTANEYGLLLGDWLDWKKFREMRNKTSHAYDRAIAMQVVQEIPRFLEEAIWLRDKLREKLQ